MAIGWVCVFLMISSSLTTEGLRRRFQRPVLLQHLHEDQCGSVVRIDCLDREIRWERSRSRLPVCVQLTDEQLLQKLKEIGGYNPLYVAINKTEAEKFQDPRTFEKEQPKEPNSTRAPDCKSNPPPTTNPPPTPSEAPTPTPNITWRPPVPEPTRPRPADVKEEGIKKNTRLETLIKKFNDFKEDDVESVRRLVKRSANDDSCWLKGAFVTGSNRRRINMCSECRLVTHLAGDEIPQYINEVACGHDLPAKSGQARHDNQCYASTGLCIQQILRFPAMKRTGYVRDDALSAEKRMEIYVERWATSTKNIRAGCKCEMYTHHAQLLKSIET